MLSILPPQKKIEGILLLPGSKSISNRVLLLNEILGNPFRPENLSDSDDTVLLQKALEQLKGTAGSVIDVGHAGSDLRFLTALLALSNGSWTLTGSERLKQRPIGALVKTLRELGADITYLEKEGFPPMNIHGKKLKGGKVRIDSGIS